MKPCLTRRDFLCKCSASLLAARLGMGHPTGLAAATEFGIQPLIAHAADGTPLYCPYGLGVSIPAMLAQHLTLFGIAEVVATTVVFAFLARRLTVPGATPVKASQP